MFEAYAIGVTLKVNNLVSPQLALLAEEFAKLDKLMLGVTGTLSKIGNSKALQKIGEAGGVTTASLDRANAAAQRLGVTLAGLHNVASRPVPQIPQIPGGGGGGGGRPSGGGGSGGGGGGWHGPGGLHGANVHMGAGGMGIGGIGWGAGDMFVPLAAGAATWWAGRAAYDSVKGYDAEQHRFRLYGMSESVNQEAFRFVDQLKITGSTLAENMKLFREAQGVFRESGLHDSEALSGAKLATPLLAKIAYASSSLDDESQAKLRTSAMSMMRWVEMSGGLKSAQEFNRLADIGWKLTQSSGGNVDWEQLRQFASTSGVAGQFLSEEGMAAMEPVIGELKGGRAGTGLRTAYNRMTGSVRVPNQVAHMLVEAGLWDAKKVMFNQNGGIKSFVGNPFKYSEEMQANPAAFYEGRIMPMYDKMKLSPQEHARYNSLFFGSTGGAEFTIIDKQLNVIHQSIEAIKRFKGITDSIDEASKSLSGQEKEFEAAWSDFKTQFGKTMLPFFSGILKGGADLLRSSSKDATPADVPSVPWDLGEGFGVWAHNKIARMFGGGPDGGRGQINPVGINTKGPQPPVHVDLHIDGKKVASVMAPHLAKPMSQMFTASGPDFGLSLPAPGAGF